MKHLNWQSLIPTTKHDAIKKAFEYAFRTSEIDAIEPLNGGRSSALVFKVTVDQKPYVLRLVLHTDALTDPARHFTCLNAASQAGIAPSVRYTNAQDAVSIVDFVEHTPISTGFAAEQELFSALTTRVKAIHDLPLFPRLVGFLDGVDAFIERFHTFDLLPPSATEEHFHRYAAVQRAYPRHDTNLVSSHNDLNPTNILHSAGKIWIIDWEVAFANDPYADLTSINTFFGAGTRGEETILSTYFGDSLSDYHRARFFLMQQVNFMYVAMLFMHLTSVTRNPADGFDTSMETMSLQEFFGQLRNGDIAITSAQEHFLFAKVLLNESLSQMKTARFKDSVALLNSMPNSPTAIC